MPVMSSTMPPLTGTEPPVSPLAEPLGTMGTLCGGELDDLRYFFRHVGLTT